MNARFFGPKRPFEHGGQRGAGAFDSDQQPLGLEPILLGNGLRSRGLRLGCHLPTPARRWRC
jgi:hypothetical protein